MKTIYDDRQATHAPQHFMANGVVQSSPETPERVTRLMSAVRALEIAVEAPSDHGLGPIAAIHTAEYVQFLRTIYPRWRRIPDAGAEVVPNIHPDARTASYPKSAVAQAGYHMADTACPIGPNTWEAAYWSAQTALTAAASIQAGETAVYALCRPPGHHAFRDLAGGFCFLNNAAIAAESLLRAGYRPALLDVDVHHGNGGQGVFYTRSDVLTVSIHADPARFYPFFWGHAHERGEGDGLGANLNLPLPRGTDDAGYLDALKAALARIEAFGADVLVVALGLDAHVNDPFQGLAVTTPGFERIATTIRDFGRPVLLVQEGGYVTDDLGPNLQAFLTPFASSAA